jgi:molybdopterin-containing oxidoreductase family iron-sulfur binding subunit
MENRPLKDGDVNTACAQSCPTNAIVFGNVNDRESRIRGMREHNPLRMFYVIEQLHTLPNVSYLAKIRNTEELVVKEGEMAEHAGQSSTGEDVPSRQGTEAH